MNLEPSLKVANIGLDLFAEALRAQGVETVEVDWQPPLVEMDAAGAALFFDPAIDAANAEAVRRMTDARPLLIDVGTARDVIPGMRNGLFLHAGPPIDWSHASGPLRGALIGAMLYEGLAQTAEEAVGRAERGEIELSPCHEHATVGPMAGVVSASMPVLVLENRLPPGCGGNRAYSTFNEGLGKVLRYGAYSADVLDRLRWIERVLAPMMRAALRRRDPIDARAMTAQALQMGDELHNRNKAATGLLTREIAAALVETDAPASDVAAVLRFMAGNDHFYLNIGMAADKVMADAAHGVAHSTVVSTMCRNGTEFGIRVSGLGDRWFTAPAQPVEGLYFPGYGPEDANPDIGDSAITETVGTGGFAMAAAPAIVQFVGGTPADALRYTQDMYAITVAEHEHFRIPQLDFRGTPTGIDVRAVVWTGILPLINTGIAHREPGIGQIGAGIVHPPAGCFVDAFRALVAER